MSSIFDDSHQLSITIALLLSLVWFGIYWRTIRRRAPPIANLCITLGWLTNFGLLLLNGWHIIDNFPQGHHLHRRWYYQAEGMQNIPTLFATAQLLFAGALALAIAWRGKLQSSLRTGFWLLFAVGFFTLATDEILSLHERQGSMYSLYLVGGAVLLLLGFWEARRTAQSSVWISLSWIYGGLFIAFLCARYLDRMPQLQCWDRLGLCFILGYWEENAELLGVLSAIAGLLAYAGVTIPLPARKSAMKVVLVSFFVSIVIIRAFSWQIPRIELLTAAQPLKIISDHSNLAVLGYRWSGPSSGGRASVSLYLRTAHPLTQRFGFSIQILAQATTRLVAKQDQWNHLKAKNWVTGRIYRESASFPLPADAPVNHAFWAALTFWRQEEDEFHPLTILTSDQQQLSDTQVVLHEFVIPAEVTAALPEAALDFRFANGFALRGAALPTEARAGETLAIPFTWQADAAGDEDWAQFLHFVPEETGTLWNHDQPPLGARLPTRLWYEGLRDTEAWQFTLPADMAPGRYALYTGLYRLSDLSRLPVTDADGRALPDARVPLGYITISE